MIKLNWKTWLAVWLGLALGGVALFCLLFFQDAVLGAKWVAVGFIALTAGWTFFGLYRWRDVPLVKRVNTFVVTVLSFAIVIALSDAVGWETGTNTLKYLAVAVLGFLVGINLLRLLLRRGHPIFGVARTMVEESLRLRISLIFIIALLIVLVVLPLILGSEDRVTYMVQRFLTYSTGIVSVLLGLMTVLLSSWSVSNELSTRQAHMTLTKPISRWQYLLGKWLGIVMLNAVLVGVSGVAIYGFTMAIAENPGMNKEDRDTVVREVLTARLALTPDPIDISWGELYANVLAEKQSRDPEKFGEVGDPIGALPNAVLQEVFADATSRFYTVDGGQGRPYRFEGLGRAADAADAAMREGRDMLMAEVGLTQRQAQSVIDAMAGDASELTQQTYDKLKPEHLDELRELMQRETIQLVLHPDYSPSPDDKFAYITMRVNGLPWPPPPGPNQPTPVQRLVIEGPNELSIPAALIDKDGTLVVTLEVPPQRPDGREQPYIRFNHKDSEIQLFYRVSSFEANLARAMAIVWLKLCFLTMFGLMAGSLLSFPVAAMAGLVVFITATFSGLIEQSLADYASIRGSGSTWDLIAGTTGTFFSNLGNGEFYNALRILLRVIGEGFMLLVPSFGQFPVADPLSNGQVISNSVLLNALLKIGLLWTGAVGLIGLFLFSKKEIARVTV